jgi:hypothetical protein
MSNFDLESLETRRLFSGLLPVSRAVTPKLPLAGVVETTAPSTLLHGILTGHYTAEDQAMPLGLILKIKHHSASNHIRGTITFKSPSGNIVADFTGRLSHTRHLSITITGDDFTGSMIATVSHTGGLIKGTYEVSGTFASVGTFRVSKA